MSNNSKSVWIKASVHRLNVLQLPAWTISAWDECEPCGQPHSTPRSIAHVLSLCDPSPRPYEASPRGSPHHLHVWGMSGMTTAAVTPQRKSTATEILPVDVYQGCGQLGSSKTDLWSSDKEESCQGREFKARVIPFTHELSKDVFLGDFLTPPDFKGRIDSWEHWSNLPVLKYTVIICGPTGYQYLVFDKNNLKETVQRCGHHEWMG